MWRKVNKELEKKNLRPTVRFDGGRVMVWGCMAASGVGDLVFIDSIIDKNVYCDILKKKSKNSVWKLGMLCSFKF